MNYIQAILLGIIQGITEFLPVSSSGHLVIFQKLFGLEEAQLSFDVLVHLATFLAIIFFFRKKILKLNIKQLLIIAVGNIPAIMAGLLLKNHLELIFSSLELVALMLIITGLINLISNKKLNLPEKNQENTFPSYKKSLYIGLFQAFAIIPGISRSGSTIFAGLNKKLDREQAFSFSFLVGIPAILGANLLQIYDLIQEKTSTNLNILVLMAGFISAFITGFISLKLFDQIIKKAKLKVFAYYCFSLATLLLFSQLIT